MGDIKKKKIENIDKIETDQDEIEFEEQIIERLRGYMKLFMEKQKEKNQEGE